MLVAVLLLGVGAVWVVANGPGQGNVPPPRRVVLVSGRDDHGLLKQPLVTLYDAPEGKTSTATLRDGTFAFVRETRGTWLHIAAAADPSLSGWTDDFYLRDRALRADGGGQVEFFDARVGASGVEVAVRPFGAYDAPLTWLPDSELREVGASDR